MITSVSPSVPTPSMLPRLLPGKPSHLDNDPDDDQEGENAVATEGSTEPDIDVPSEGKTDNQMLLKLLEEGEKVGGPHHVFLPIRSPCYSGHFQ